MQCQKDSERGVTAFRVVVYAPIVEVFQVKLLEVSGVKLITRLWFCCQKNQSSLTKLNAATFLLSCLSGGKQRSTNHQADLWRSKNNECSLWNPAETIYSCCVSKFVFPPARRFHHSFRHNFNCGGRLTFCSLRRGMSAVCVYTVGHIHNVFMRSSFIGQQSTRSRQASVKANLLLLMNLNWMPFICPILQW